LVGLVISKYVQGLQLQEQQIESTDHGSRWASHSWLTDDTRLSRLSWQS